MASFLDEVNNTLKSIIDDAWSNALKISLNNYKFITQSDNKDDTRRHAIFLL